MSFATFAASSQIWSTLGIPSARIPVDGTTFMSHIIPPVIFYFASAVLAVTPQTRAVRVALWPVIAFLALRAVLSVDMSHGRPERSSLNTCLVLFMFFGAIRSLGWALEKAPLVRFVRPRNSAPSTIMDALDLVSSYRGHGWNWSRQLYIPRETRPTNRKAFALHVSLSAVVHAFVYTVCNLAAFTMLPVGAGKIPGGSTLFDETLPFWLRYLRACIISVLIALATYGGIQVSYDMFTITGVLFFGQDPIQWPPAFDSPWRATSLSDFWGRRWHQFLRQIFLLLGGYPLSLVLGRDGIVIGAFLASALWHHVIALTLDPRIEFWWTFIGFGMMGPGILAERAFRRLTGRRVGGLVGWIWTMSWLLVWGNMFFEGLARLPLDRSILDSSVLPVQMSVERLVRGFDDWLHTI